MSVSRFDGGTDLVIVIVIVVRQFDVLRIREELNSDMMPSKLYIMVVLAKIFGVSFPQLQTGDWPRRDLKLSTPSFFEPISSLEFGK